MESSIRPYTCVRTLGGGGKKEYRESLLLPPNVSFPIFIARELNVTLCGGCNNLFLHFLLFASLLHLFLSHTLFLFLLLSQITLEIILANLETLENVW